MKNKLLIIILGASLFSALTFASDRSVNTAKENLNVAIQLMDFSSTSNTGKMLSSKNSLNSLIGLFFLPGAFIFDVTRFCCGVIGTPYCIGKLTVEMCNKFIDDYINNHEEDELKNMTLRGYKMRLEQVRQTIGDQEISAEAMMALVLANTAWDSKEQAPDYLVLGSGQKLKRDTIEKKQKDLPRGCLDLYDAISKASRKIEFCGKNGYESLMKKLVEYLTTNKEFENIGWEALVTALKNAAQIGLSHNDIIEKNEDEKGIDVTSTRSLVEQLEEKLREKGNCENYS